MHALIPLLLIFILFNSRQFKTDKLYRANIFALIGISYFFLFQYTIYWYRIFPTDSAVQFIPGFLITSATVLIALSRWNKKSHPVKTAVLCGLCIVAVVTTFGFDKTIKEKLAEAGGYFADGPITRSDSAEKNVPKTVEMPVIGLQIDVPAHWAELTSPSGHRYFTAENNGQSILEVRPNCLGDFEIDTPTFVLNTLDLFEAGRPGAKHSGRCVGNNDVKECLLVVKYSGSTDMLEKWRWLKVPQDRSRSMMVDFLIFANAASVQEDILHLITSAKPLRSGPTEPCRTPAAWL